MSVAKCFTGSMLNADFNYVLIILYFLSAYSEEFTPATTPLPYSDPDPLPEDCIPSLNDILAASFANVSCALNIY